MTREQFDALPISERRMLIARDVIENIKAKRIVPKRGQYVNLRDMPTYWKIAASHDVQSNFDKIQQCPACALGSMLISTTKYKDKLNFANIGHRVIVSTEDMRYTYGDLAEIFSPEQLERIEVAFEGTWAGDNIGRDIFNAEQPEGVSLSKYSHYFDHLWNDLDTSLPYDEYHRERQKVSEKILIAIMQNIIEHGGEFVIE